jgi:hypothetical protein
MQFLSAEIDVARPVPVVWAQLLDVAGYPSWLTDLTAVELLPMPLQRSSELVTRFLVGGRRMVFTFEVCALRPPTATDDGVFAIEARVGKGDHIFVSARVHAPVDPSRTRVSFQLEVMTGNRLAELVAHPFGMMREEMSEPLRKHLLRASDAFRHTCELAGGGPYRSATGEPRKAP